MRAATRIFALLPLLRAFAQNVHSFEAPLEGRSMAQDISPAQQDEMNFDIVTESGTSECNTSSSASTVLTVTQNITITTCTQCVHAKSTDVPQSTAPLSTPLPVAAEGSVVNDQMLSPSTEPLNASTSTVYATSYAYTCSSEAPVSAFLAMNSFINDPPHWINQTEPTILPIDPEIVTSVRTPSSYPTDATGTLPCPTTSSLGSQPTNTGSQIPDIGNSATQAIVSSFLGIIYLAFLGMWGAI